MNEKLTIFFNKRTGSIKELCSGEQNMSWFGDEEEDYNKIFDFIIVDHDDYIFENYMNMEVKGERVRMIQRDTPEKYM